MQQACLVHPLHRVRVRDAEPIDAARIVEMVEALAAHHGDSANVSLGELLRDIFGPTPWIYAVVAEDEAGVVIGYAVLSPLVKLQFGQRGLDLHHLYVAPSERGRGVGAALITAAKDKARALRCSYLAVVADPSNLAAQAFYDAQGFERRPSYPPRFVYRIA